MGLVFESQIDTGVVFERFLKQLMGNCGACCFFCCIDPIARANGKRNAGAQTESVISTKNHIKRAIRGSKRRKEKTAWIEFSNQYYPVETLKDAAEYFILHGYTVITTPGEDGRGTRMTLAWK